MNSIIHVYLDSIECVDTESLHSSDKVVFALAAATDSAKDSQFVGPIRINSGEIREFTPSMQVFRGSAENPYVGISILGVDQDRNEGWEDSESVRRVAVAAMGTVIELLSHNPVAGMAWEVGMEAIQHGIEQAISGFDRDDVVFETSEVHHVPGGGMFSPRMRTMNIKHVVDDPTGYSASEYVLTLRVVTVTQGVFPESTSAFPRDAHFIRAFRRLDAFAEARGLPGAFPNGQYGRAEEHDGSVVYTGGVIVLNNGAAESRRARAEEFGDPTPSFEDLAGTVRAANDLAFRLNEQFVGGPRYVGAFPAFRSVTVSTIIGTPPDVTLHKIVLVLRSQATLRYVPVAELDRPPLDDIGRRLRAADDYALRMGFVGAIPTFAVRNDNGVELHGHMLFHSTAGTRESERLGILR